MPNRLMRKYVGDKPSQFLNLSCGAVVFTPYMNKGIHPKYPFTEEYRLLLEFPYNHNRTFVMLIVLVSCNPIQILILYLTKNPPLHYIKECRVPMRTSQTSTIFLGI
jgi:hypothetical protein